MLAIRRAELTDEGVHCAQGTTGTKLTVSCSHELRAATERAKTLKANIRALTLLHNRRGKTPDYRTVKLQWDKACEAAGVADAHMHDVRAKSLTDAKRPGKTQPPWLGTQARALTERYIRLRESPVVEGPRTRGR